MFLRTFFVRSENRFVRGGDRMTGEGRGLWFALIAAIAVLCATVAGQVAWVSGAAPLVVAGVAVSVFAGAIKLAMTVYRFLRPPGS